MLPQWHAGTQPLISERRVALCLDAQLNRIAFHHTSVYWVLQDAWRPAATSMQTVRGVQQPTSAGRCFAMQGLSASARHISDEA
jgi:hypothetical protein